MIDRITVTMEIPAECNVITGQSHFIETVEDGPGLDPCRQMRPHTGERASFELSRSSQSAQDLGRTRRWLWHSQT
jgi:hypothetical protein